jgi:hypothetical protein
MTTTCLAVVVICPPYIAPSAELPFLSLKLSSLCVCYPLFLRKGTNFFPLQITINLLRQWPICMHISHCTVFMHLMLGWQETNFIFTLVSYQSWSFLFGISGWNCTFLKRIWNVLYMTYTLKSRIVHYLQAQKQMLFVNRCSYLCKKQTVAWNRIHYPQTGNSYAINSTFSF